MKAFLTAIALSVILIGSFGIMPVFAQFMEPIVVTTDKLAYDDGDTILISGEVKDLFSQVPVALQIIASNGNLVTIAQLDVGVDKRFSTQVTAGGHEWRTQGTYTIIVTYGAGANPKTAETTFEYTGGTGTGGPSGTFIDVEGFPVFYKITGGSVLSIIPDVDSNSLIIEISTTSDGELIITLPRQLIDAVLDTGEDDEFFVLVDAEEVDFDETKTSDSRTLTIGFPFGAEEIEIIGTFVIPEFGVIAGLILAVSIMSIIAVSAKARLRIIPRF
jgi:predicted secreted protein with PEFG-CTERM motif